MVRGGRRPRKCGMSRIGHAPALRRRRIGPAPAMRSGREPGPAQVLGEYRPPAVRPPARLRRRPLGEQVGGQLEQSPGVDPALEVDDLVDRPPVIHPAPAVELGRMAQVEAQPLLGGDETQQEPALLLADADRVVALAPAADVALGQAIGDPVPGGTQDPDVVALEAEFLVQLPEHRLLRALAPVDAALGELPPLAPGAAGQQQTAGVVRQYDADVRAEAVLVDIVGIHGKPLGRHSSTIPNSGPATGSLMTLPQKLLLPGLALLALACLGAALATGSASLPAARVAEILAGGGSPGERDLVLELRLPRALSAFAVGGLLALAGVLMQVLLRNPLADPYILGTSGGAAVGALAALSVGLAPWAVDAGA